MYESLTELKGEMDRNIIIVGDFNPSFQLWIEQPDRRSIRKQRA